MLRAPSLEAHLMTSDANDFVTIRPRQVPLTTAAEPAPLQRSSPRRLLPIAGIVLLVIAAAWVFFFMPDRVVEAPATVQGSGAAAPSRRGDAPAAPFERMTHERERKAAQDLLARFVELQIRLDDEMQVNQWAADAFAAAQRLANEGDQRFLKENFPAAMALYEEGIAALETLVTEGQARFDQALASGLEALARGSSETALAAFDVAAIIHPDDERLLRARERATVLPQVLDLRRDGELAEGRRELREAIGFYEQALALDPTQPDLAPRIGNLRQALADADFANRISAGYAALDAGDLSAARIAFADAARRRPGDRAAVDGLAQVDQSTTLNRIEATRMRADRLAAAEDWANAAAAYGEVLKVDGTIKFARDGRERAQRRAALDSRLTEVLGNPTALSSDDALQIANSVYAEALAVTDAGPRLTEQRTRLEGLLALAARPIAVTFTSDAATEVTVYRIGAIGRFSQKVLELRPGRYVVTGSRPGRRDVRLDVIVGVGMGPVDVRCAETI